MPFKQIGKEGNWIRVKDLDKDTYWVHRSLTTKKHMCAVIKKNKTNVTNKYPTKRSIKILIINIFFSYIKFIYHKYYALL